MSPAVAAVNAATALKGRIATILRDVRDTRRLRAIIRARTLLESRGYVVRVASATDPIDELHTRALNELRLEVARLKAALVQADSNNRVLARRNAHLESWMRAASAGVRA